MQTGTFFLFLHFTRCMTLRHAMAVCGACLAEEATVKKSPGRPSPNSASSRRTRFARSIGIEHAFQRRSRLQAAISGLVKHRSDRKIAANRIPAGRRSVSDSPTALAKASDFYLSTHKSRLFCLPKNSHGPCRRQQSKRTAGVDALGALGAHGPDSHASRSRACATGSMWPLRSS